ncbi:hypothetical protein I552_4558 [Mycobacterium xenopi 3993]|nr:hypothetical protein I552_4558 [Mycobacterium xenopi 3993]
MTATWRILAALPQTRVLVVTTYETDADILRAVEAAAAAVLPPTANTAPKINVGINQGVNIHGHRYFRRTCRRPAFRPARKRTCRPDLKSARAKPSDVV